MGIAKEHGKCFLPHLNGFMIENVFGKWRFLQCPNKIPVQYTARWLKSQAGQPQEMGK